MQRFAVGRFRHVPLLHVSSSGRCHCASSCAARRRSHPVSVSQQPRGLPESEVTRPPSAGQVPSTGQICKSSGALAGHVLRVSAVSDTRLKPGCLRLAVVPRRRLRHWPSQGPTREAQRWQTAAMGWLTAALPAKIYPAGVSCARHCSRR